VGGELASIERLHNVRVIGLTPAGAGLLTWLPSPGHRLRAGDRATVVARRAGLRWLAEQATPLPEPPAAEPGSAPPADGAAAAPS
jgi:hypothetical protein